MSNMEQNGEINNVVHKYKVASLLPKIFITWMEESCCNHKQVKLEGTPPRELRKENT